MPARILNRRSTALSSAPNSSARPADALIRAYYYCPRGIYEDSQKSGATVAAKNRNWKEKRALMRELEAELNDQLQDKGHWTRESYATLIAKYMSIRTGLSAKPWEQAYNKLSKNCDILYVAFQRSASGHYRVTSAAKYKLYFVRFQQDNSHKPHLEIFGSCGLDQVYKAVLIEEVVDEYASGYPFIQGFVVMHPDPDLEKALCDRPIDGHHWEREDTGLHLFLPRTH